MLSESRVRRVRVERHNSVGALEADWDALADRAGALPWLRPGWVRAWHDAFGRGVLEIVALRRDDGRLTALAALERRGARLHSTTNWHTPEFELLSEDDEARRELVAVLLADRPQRLELSFAPRSGGGLDEVRSMGRAKRFRVLERVVERSPYVPVESSWESYLASRRRDLVKDLARRRRRLGEQGEVTFELRDGREGLEELLVEGFRLESSGWKAENGTAIVSRPNTLRFYTTVASWAAERGWLRLAFLRLDGNPLAFEFTLETGGALFNLKGGYDQEWRKFGPGKLLAEDLLRYVFERRLSSYEFLGSEEPFKLEWTSVCRDRMLLQAFAPSPRGLVDWAAYAFGRPLAKRLLALRQR